MRALKGSVPRGKWTVTICVVAIFGCLLVTWIPTVVWVGGNRCFGELIWIPFRYRRVLVPLISVLLFAYIVLASLLALKLRYDPNFDADERVSASRMVCYLTFAIIEHVSIGYSIIRLPLTRLGPHHSILHSSLPRQFR